MWEKEIKIAVSSTGPTLDDAVDPRFGRCAFFLLINPNTMDLEPIQNPNIAMGGGAGIQSAQLMANRSVSVVLTGNCGPNAFRTFGAAGIQVITGTSGTVREAVERFKAGELSPASAPSVDTHSGMGRTAGKRAGGMAMFGGRGMGGGRSAGPSGAAPSSRQEELDRLRRQADEMQNQLEAMESRLKKLEDQ